MRQHLQAVCPVCDSPNNKKVYDDELGDALPTVDYNFSPQTRKTYQIVECVDCSHQFVHPLPNLTNLYQENVDDAYLKSAPQRRRSALEWLRILTAYASPEASSLIDIGCATGIFLDEAAHRYRVEGIELSAWAADLASSRHQIHRIPVSEMKTDRHFDIASMWGVIEHLDYPATEISAVRELLNDSGLLFIYTGDRNALLPRLLGKRWWWYQGMHIQYFTKSSLTRLLQSCGFAVIGQHRLPVFFSVPSLAQSLNRYRMMRPLVWLLKNLPDNGLVKLSLSGEMLLVAQKV